MRASTYLLMKTIEERVLEAATNLLVRHGYQATTTKRIAEEAHVNEVTLFRKFQNKEELFRAAIRNEEKNALEFLDDILQIEQNTDVRSFLSILGQGLFRFSKDKNNLLILQFTEGLRDPTVAKSLSSIPQKVLAYLTEYFKTQMKRGNLRHLNPKNAALIFLSYISYSHLIQNLLDKDFLIDRETSFDDFLDVFTGGIVQSENSKY